MYRDSLRTTYIKLNILRATGIFKPQSEQPPISQYAEPVFERRVSPSNNVVSCSERILCECAMETLY